MSWRWVCALAICCGGLGLPSPARATRIFYEAIDLPDGSGGDLWRYRWTVSDFAYPANHGFSIAFEVGLYEDLEDPPPAVSPDWDVLTLQPDPGLPHPGVYDALALIDEPSLAPVFQLDFVWLGQDLPGAQPFAVSEYDATGAFVAVLEESATEPLPEPSVLALVALLLVPLVRR